MLIPPPGGVRSRATRVRHTPGPGRDTRRTAHPALTLAERLLRSPPATLSAREALLGPLKVDFAGGHGMGSLWRPPPRAAPGGPPVAPEDDARRPPYRARVGAWFFEPTLGGWPRGPKGADLPRRRELGPSPCNDVEGKALKVCALLVTPVDAGEGH